jgi:hypothetical protein
MALKQRNAVPEQPVRTGCRDGEERSELVLNKYIDLPEGSELRPSHLMRVGCEMSSRKSIYFAWPQSAFPVCSASQALCAFEAAGMLSCRFAGFFRFLFTAGVLLSIPTIFSCQGSTDSFAGLENGPISPWYGR